MSVSAQEVHGYGDGGYGLVPYGGGEADGGDGGGGSDTGDLALLALIAGTAYFVLRG